jgi:hypothetical protein
MLNVNNLTVMFRFKTLAIFTRQVRKQLAKNAERVSERGKTLMKYIVGEVHEFVPGCTFLAAPL